VGRLLGMSRPGVVGAIATGAVIGCFGIALATLYLKQAFLSNFFLGAALLLFLIMAGVLIYWLSRRYLNRR
jgi:hypothetical protein